MMKTLRNLSLAATVAAAALTATSASAQTAQAGASANIRRPLVLTSDRPLAFGDILLSGTGTYSATVSVAQDGTRACPASVTCSGTPTSARYNVRGSNNQVVTITAPPVTLTNANPGGATLTMTTSAPPTVTLTSSGAPGNNFTIGGSIIVTDTTQDGLYSGTFNVTVNY